MLSDIITNDQLKEIAKHFIAACIWADSPEGTYPRATNEAKEKALEFVKGFVNTFPDLSNEAIKNDSYGWYYERRNVFAQFGHDLYLTTVGHGAGFWDRKELEENDLGERLKDACKEYGQLEPEFYRGWLYLR